MATGEKTNDAATPKTTGHLREMSDRRRIIMLAVGDVMVFLVFATLGMDSHNEITSPAGLAQVVLVAAPFALGWFLVAPFVGAFGPDVANEPRKMFRRTLLAWTLAWPVGLALRWLFVGHIPPASFALVVFVFNLIILLVWRWPFAVNNSIRVRERTARSE
jgi:Protein of unknown function (DUF3054)